MAKFLPEVPGADSFPPLPVAGASRPSLAHAGVDHLHLRGRVLSPSLSVEPPLWVSFKDTCHWISVHSDNLG